MNSGKKLENPQKITKKNVKKSRMITTSRTHDTTVRKLSRGG